MKYCTVYHQHSTAAKTADEIIINYNNDIKVLLSFLLNHCSKQRVIIEIKDFNTFIKDKEIEKIKIIQQEHPELNFTLLLPNVFPLGIGITTDADMMIFIQELQKYKIPFFTKDRCGTWDKLYVISQLGVTDVYVVEGLGFNLPLVSTFAKERQIAVRTFANVAQYGAGPLPLKLNFFIRPEDISIYEPYIDTIEFFIGKELDVLYQIYTKDQQWYGNLQEIINGLPSPLYSNYLFPGWADKRIDCDRKCMKGDPCSLCDSYAAIANKLQEIDTKSQQTN